MDLVFLVFNCIILTIFSYPLFKIGKVLGREKRPSSISRGKVPHHSSSRILRYDLLTTARPYVDTDNISNSLNVRSLNTSENNQYQTTSLLWKWNQSEHWQRCMLYFGITMLFRRGMYQCVAEEPVGAWVLLYAAISNIPTISRLGTSEIGFPCCTHVGIQTQCQCYSCVFSLVCLVQARLRHTCLPTAGQKWLMLLACFLLNRSNTEAAKVCCRGLYSI